MKDRYRLRLVVPAWVFVTAGACVFLPLELAAFASALLGVMLLAGVIVARQEERLEELQADAQARAFGERFAAHLRELQDSFEHWEFKMCSPSHGRHAHARRAGRDS